MIQRLVTFLTATTVAVLNAVSSLATPAPALLGRRRAAGFLEYALLGALAVAVFLLLNAAFPGIINTLFTRIRTAVGG